MKNAPWALALAGAFIVTATARAQFADAALSYNSGTGFVSGYTSPNSALGAPALGGSVTPFSPPFSSGQLVSIGAGGEITLQLSAPIVNNPANPYGIDFIVFANEFFVSSSGKVSGLFDHAASTLLQVSADDSTWYTLNPSLAPQPGALYPTSGSGNPFVAVNPALTLADFTGLNVAGINSLYNGSAGGTGYDLSWAQDANGNSVDLPSADFVRIEVQSGVLDLDAVSAVPEPSTWALLAVGVILFLLPRRRLVACVVLSAGLLAANSSRAAITLTEEFTGNPLTSGWQVFGDTNLFDWNATNQNLAVTWDSSNPNSYFYHPLGTTLTRDADFTISFDLQLTNAGASGYGFELAIGLFDLAEATNANFNRSTGENSPDLVELDYFPDVGYGPTVWPQFVDENSLFNYNGASDYAIYAPNLADWYQVVMTYTASSQTMVTTVSNFEGTSGVTIVDPIEGPPFANFHVDTFSISSYQDDGFGDSIFAQGAVANLNIRMSPPPVQALAGQFNNAAWSAQFFSLNGWHYTLQRTCDLQSWTNVSPLTAGNAASLTLLDTNPPPTQAFYRVRASQP